MGPVTAPPDLPVHRCGDQAAFEAWLEAEHERSPGIHVVTAKKGAPEPTLKQSEMVESLLCFGWIDGQVKRLDEHHFTTRVTPRRAKSVWSAKNVEWVGRLIEAGRMRPAGLAAVEAATGRWPVGPRLCRAGVHLRARRPHRGARRAPGGDGVLRAVGRRQPLRRPVAGAHDVDAAGQGEADRRPGADARRGPHVPLRRVGTPNTNTRPAVLAAAADRADPPSHE